MAAIGIHVSLPTATKCHLASTNLVRETPEILGGGGLAMYQTFMFILWPYNHPFVSTYMCLNFKKTPIPWLPASCLYVSDCHGHNVTIFPVSSAHVNMWVWLTSTSVYSSASSHSSLFNWWFASCFAFFYSVHSFLTPLFLLPTTYLLSFPSIPTTHTHT